MQLQSLASGAHAAGALHHNCTRQVPLRLNPGMGPELVSAHSRQKRAAGLDEGKMRAPEQLRLHLVVVRMPKASKTRSGVSGGTGSLVRHQKGEGARCGECCLHLWRRWATDVPQGFRKRSAAGASCAGGARSPRNAGVGRTALDARLGEAVSGSGVDLSPRSAVAALALSDEICPPPGSTLEARKVLGETSIPLGYTVPEVRPLPRNARPIRGVSQPRLLGPSDVEGLSELDAWLLLGPLMQGKSDCTPSGPDPGALPRFTRPLQITAWRCPGVGDAGEPRTTFPVACVQSPASASSTTLPAAPLAALRRPLGVASSSRFCGRLGRRRSRDLESVLTGLRPPSRPRLEISASGGGSKTRV